MLSVGRPNVDSMKNVLKLAGRGHNRFSGTFQIFFHILNDGLKSTIRSQMKNEALKKANAVSSYAQTIIAGNG